VVQVEQAMDEADTILVSPGREPDLDREKGVALPRSRASLCSGLR